MFSYYDVLLSGAEFDYDNTITRGIRSNSNVSNLSSAYGGSNKLPGKGGGKNLGGLYITSINCRDLLLKTGRNKSGTELNPFLHVTCNHMSKETSVMAKTSQPIFKLDNNWVFGIKNPQFDVLTIEIKNKGHFIGTGIKSLGSVSFNVNQFCAQPHVVITTKEQQLDCDAGEGFIMVTAEFREYA